jgi:catechol 2,3-dioxygenase-like lactoylglutathione lyase family enzyme
MANDAPITPRGVNHLVLNVSNIEASHQFWTEIIGLKCVAQLKSTPDRPRPKMRFYSGLDPDGRVSHHDLALCEVPKGTEASNGDRPEWSLVPRGVGFNHVAITWPDRESWLKQVEYLQSKRACRSTGA